MERYASKEASIAALNSLGFVQIVEEEYGEHIFFDSPKENYWRMPVVQISIYKSNAGYWCVDVEGGYRAPCVWKGSRAEWDKTHTLVEFTKFLDANHPGWK